MRAGVVILVMVYAVGGCGSKKSKDSGETGGSENGAGTGTASADDGGAAATKRRKPDAPAAIDEAEARKILDAWLAAQNGGRFDDYGKLYAEQFFGVKRVGDNKTTYDRAGWLEDRARMFKNKMVVEATRVTISSSPRSAVVHFTQTWSSGKFRDQGPKQLIVIEEKGALRISREEMLSSHPAPALAAWAKAAKRNKFVEGKALPEALKLELARISDGVQGGETLGYVQFAMALSPDLVVYGIESERQETEDGGDPNWDRGATAHLVLANNGGGKFIVAAAYSEIDVTYGDPGEVDDLDGDGIGDPEFGYSWYHDHEGGESALFVLSKSRTISSIQTNHEMGEMGYSAARKVTAECAVKVDGQLAYLVAYWELSSEPEAEEHWEDSDSIETAAPGFDLFVAGDSGFEKSPAFGFWTKKGDSSLVAETTPAPCEVPQGAFAINGLATTLEDGTHHYIVRALSLSKAAAKRKAAAVGKPEPQVVELLSWDELMKRKHGPNKAFSKPEASKLDMPEFDEP